jgi:L-amino acid N-acyltransferase YncA
VKIPAMADEPDAIRIEPMLASDASAVRRIHLDGIATGVATLELDRSHHPTCRFVARRVADDQVVGWVALTSYSSRRVYAGVAWESVYVAAAARGQGVGRALLAALIAASEAAGIWTLLAGVLADNAPSLALHERAGFRRVGVQERLGQDVTGRWRDVVLLERRRTEEA